MEWMISIPIAYIVMGFFQVLIDLSISDPLRQPGWVLRPSFVLVIWIMASWFFRPILLMIFTRRGLGGGLYAFTLSSMRLLILSSVVRFFILVAQEMTQNIWYQIAYTGGMLIGIILILRLLPLIIAIADLLTGMLFVIFRITGMWKGIRDPSQKP